MTASRVRQVRELLGWTQSELANRSSLSQPTISDIESGKVVPTNDTLESISSATGFRIGWLLRDDLEPLPEGTLQFRKKAATSQRENAQARRRLEVADELVRSLERGLRLPPVRIQPGLPPSSEADIEMRALAVREQLGLAANGPVSNALRAAERSGVLVIGLTVDLSGHSGISAWPDFDGRPIVGIKIDDSGDRQRFTLCHELGHLAMHMVRPSPNAETEAHRFAGAFLMPESDARDALTGMLTLTTLMQLKSAWGISISALIQRAFNLGIINDTKRVSLHKQISARRWNKSEPVYVQREVPKVFLQVVEAKFGNDASAVSSHFGIPVMLVRELLGASQRDGDVARVLRLSQAPRRAR